MKTHFSSSHFFIALFALFAVAPVRAAQPWQEVTMPTVAEAAASFANPPKEYGAIHWATGFPPPKERILSDIAHLDANGGSVYMINSGGRSVKYLSPEYFDLMKVAVDELKSRGMKMWIDGDDGYPDGFAGGMISRLYPQLGMQGIVADARYTVAPAASTFDIPPAGGHAGRTPRGTMRPAARAGRRSAGNRSTRPRPGRARSSLLPADGNFKWTGPSGAALGRDL